MNRNPCCLRGFLAAALILASVGVAQPAPAQPGPSAPRWEVDWGQPFCSLSRRVTGTAPVDFGFQIVPGAETGQIVLIAPDPAVPALNHRAPAVVMLNPGEARFEGSLETWLKGNSRRIIVAGVKTEFLDRITEASELRLSQGTRERMRFDIPPTAAAAVAALRKCIDAGMARWGIDLQAVAALRQRPGIQEGHQWATANDYPHAAFVAGASGMTVARLTINAGGRVTDCAVVQSAGHAALDATTCRLALKRARYRPAIGSDGKPTRAQVITFARWALIG